MEEWSLLEKLGAGASLVAIIAGIYGAFRWGGKVYAAARQWITRYKPTVPRETIRAMPHGRNWWHMGSTRDKPAMQIVTDWLFTNISDIPSVVAQAFMVRGWLRRKHESHMIFPKIIPPGATIDARVDFWVNPPFQENGKSFRAKLILIDHLGNHHKTPWITIPSSWRPEKEEVRPVEESIHSIANPLVKQVVTILKDEVSRYAECGRGSGGLGSVHVTYQGRSLRGIGYQGWESESPKRQWLVPDPDKATLQSDNIDALTELWAHETDHGKEIIVASLLERISSESEYAPIGYFFMFFLARAGNLPAGLPAIKSNLRGEKHHEFSNALMILSGVLQYQYPKLSDETLDEIERFMDGMEKPPFKLKERCIAARAVNHQKRLASRGGALSDIQNVGQP